MSLETDPLLNSKQSGGGSGDTHNEEVYPPIDPDIEANLEEAANAVYESIVDELNQDGDLEEEALLDDNEDDDPHDEDLIHLREQRLLNSATQWHKRPSLYIISLVTFMLAFGSSSGESSRQVIQYKLACNSLARLGEGVCDPKQTQVLVSNYQIVSTISMGIVSSIAAGKIGPLSDQYGRKLFIVLITVCFTVGRFSKFLVMNKSPYLQFVLMVLCDILTSLCGGVLLLVAITNCYICDVVEIKDRIYSLGIGIASLFLGLSTGPLAGNFILSYNKPQSMSIDTSGIFKHEFAPLKFELCVYVVVVCYTLFILPESRSAKARKKSRSLSVTEVAHKERTSWFSVANFLKPLRLLIIPKSLKPRMPKERLRKERIAVILLVISDCIVTGTGMALAEVFLLYGIYKFDWTQIDIGHLLAASCSAKAVTLIIFSPLANHKILQNVFKFKVLKKQYDMIDFSMAYFGLTIDAILFVFISLAPSHAIFMFFVVLTGLGTVSSPTLNSSIPKFYPESKLGEVFGALALLKNLCQLAGPFTFLTIYKTGLARWDKPHLVFQVAAFLLAIASTNQLIVKRILNLNGSTRPQSSRCGSVSSFDQFGTDPSTTKQPNVLVNYTELHRKNSFIHSERTKK